MMFSLGLALLSILSHVWTPGVIPSRIQSIFPAIGSFCTGCAVGSFGGIKVCCGNSCVILCAAGVAYWILNVKLMSTVSLRFLLFPLIFSIIAIIPVYYGAKIMSFVAVAILFAQGWSILSGITMIACYPSLIRTATVEPSHLVAHHESAIQQLVDELHVLVTDIRVPTSWGTYVETTEVMLPERSTDRWILYLMGNGELREEIVYLLGKLAVTVRANLILFNPRGVGFSGGYPIRSSNFVEDAAAVSNFYINRHGISHKNFMLLGHSFGGGVAGELVSRHFSDVPFVVDRSFSKLSDAANAHIPVVGKYAVKLFIGDLSCIKGWNSLVHLRKIIFYARLDPVIPFSNASIARLDQFREGESHSIVELTSRNNVSWHELSLLFFDEECQVVQRMIRLYDQEG